MATSAAATWTTARRGCSTTPRFLCYLKNPVGFDGWRYDMVKGCPGYYAGMCNDASAPVFSVGEFSDSNRQLLSNWIAPADSDPGRKNAFREYRAQRLMAYAYTLTYPGITSAI